MSVRGISLMLSAVLSLAAFITACADDLRREKTDFLTWEAQPPPAEGPAVYFSAGEFSRGRLVATIAARGLERVAGFALRLRVDEGKWRFVEFRPASAWTRRPHAAAAARGGLVLLGVGLPADSGGEDFAGRPVGTLVFEVADPSAAALDFVPERSAVLDLHGEPVPGVTFQGGGLAPRR